MSESVNGLELLREEMEEDQIETRINCIHRLSAVVQAAMPNEAQVRDIIKFLMLVAKREEDEVLFALAEELGLVGDTLAQNGHTQLLGGVLEILELLMQVEETMVRQRSVESVQMVAKVLSEMDVVSLVVPIVLRLAKNETNFTSRVSGVHLITSTYSKAGKMKEYLRQQFNELSHEETPMVKRAVALQIGGMAKVLEKQYLVNELVQQFKDLANDDQDSVRVNTLQSLNLIVTVLPKEMNKTHILPMLIQSTEDKSWRIRHALALNFPQLVTAFLKELQEMNLMAIFLSLLRDAENEVKLQALKSLVIFVKQLPHDKILSLIPGLQSLHKDPQSEVRQGVCDVTVQVIQKLKKDTQLLKFQPQIMALAEDDELEVRVKNLQVLGAYVGSLGNDQLAQFLPLLAKTKQDAKWRLRHQTILAVIQISLEIKNYDQFTQNLEPMITNALKDKVYQIRVTAISGIKQILGLYGHNWLDKSLLIKLQELLNPQTNYLIRISAVYALEAGLGVVPNDYFVSKVLPVMLKAAKDPVKNVRIAFTKSSLKIVKVLLNNKAVLTDTLLSLANDQDKDISFFAKECLALS